LFYNGQGLNRQPYTAGAFDEVVKPDKLHATPYVKIKAEQHDKPPGDEYTTNYHRPPYCGIQEIGLFQLQTLGCDSKLKHPPFCLPQMPSKDLTDDELVEALFNATDRYDQPEFDDAHRQPTNGPADDKTVWRKL
jgi:hypothetical protein